MKRVLTALAATLPFAANAADAISGAVERQPTNWQAIIMFLIFVVFTLGITYWALMNPLMILVKIIKLR
ncbi:hypothetical protein FSG81_025950 [Escherichia coli]|nr:hypothetical protein [Escherichia coli]